MKIILALAFLLPINVSALLTKTEIVVVTPRGNGWFNKQLDIKKQREENSGNWSDPVKTVSALDI
jgi:hypothetical protein